MSQVAFDTLKFTETLKQAGVPDQQAKAEAVAIQGALGEALNTQVATKEDMHNLKQEIIKLDAKLDARVDSVDARIDNVDTRLTAKINLVHWMIGFNIILTMGILWKLFIPAS